MTNMLLAESVNVNAGETFLICLIGFLLIMVVLALLIGVTCAMKWRRARTTIISRKITTRQLRVRRLLWQRKHWLEAVAEIFVSVTSAREKPLWLWLSLQISCRRRSIS